jgi:zinc transporter 1/2/3
VLFFFTYFFAYLPFLIKSFKTNKTLVSLANCLAGGIFLCAGLLHIIPEAQESWEKATKEVKAAYPDLRHDDHDDHGEPFPTIPFAIMVSFSLLLLFDRVILPGHHSHEAPSLKSSMGPTTQIGSDIEGDLVDPLNDSHQNQDHEHGQSIGPYMLVAAMGFHAFFEGLALGLMNDFSGFLGFFAAIIFHKWAEAAAIGISFLTTNIKLTPTLISLGIFSALTPLGVATGIIFSKADEKIKAILMAVSAGTFLYIAIAEILAEEFNSKVNAIKKYVAFSMGMALMVGVWFIEQLGAPHQH